VNTIDGLFGMAMGNIMCHGCQMVFTLGEARAMWQGEFWESVKLDAKVIERRALNRERLREHGFQFTETQLQQEQRESAGAGLV
jgi:hypothetical protein